MWGLLFIYIFAIILRLNYELCRITKKIDILFILYCIHAIAGSQKTGGTDMYNFLSPLLKPNSFLALFSLKKETTPHAVHMRDCYWKLCFMLDSIYLSWVFQIAVIKYGFNNN